MTTPNDFYLNLSDDDLEGFIQTKGDIRITNNQILLVPVEDVSRTTAQRLHIGILTRMGEWFRDLSSGFDYHRFTQEKGNTDQFDAAMKSYILSHDGVVSLLSYRSELSLAERTVRVTFTVRCSDLNDATIDVEV